jgi:tripartite-type tricarboxylate transporter receptor subunit TctC
MLAPNPKVCAASLRERLALTKGAKPVNSTTGGIGSLQHLATELLGYMAKVKMNHVSYKGGNQGLLDIIAGHVDFTLTTTLTVIPHARAGRAQPRSVSSGTMASTAMRAFSRSTVSSLLAIGCAITAKG